MALRAIPLFILTALLPVAAHADFDGKVVGVADGDTLTVQRSDVAVKVRLVEIDAPEKGQPFGDRARHALADLCAGKIAHLVERGKDRYGRTLARVECAGIDANAELVRQGMAWAFTKYLTDPGIKSIEVEARASRLGLWADQDPVPPWDWRRSK